MENCRGVFAAAALVFLAGVAGALGIARSLGGGFGWRLGLSCNRGYVLAVVFEGGSHFIDFIEFVLAEAVGDLAGDGFSDLGEVGYAEMREVGAGLEVFVAKVALGLELAEFGGAFVEHAMGLRAGAIYGILRSGCGFVLHGVVGLGGLHEGGLDFAAAAETPEGPMDFVGETGFEDAGGGELIEEIGSVLFVERFFAGADEIAGGEEAVGGGVFGTRGFASIGTGSGGGLGVGDVGGDLGWGGGHGFFPSDLIGSARVPGSGMRAAMTLSGFRRACGRVGFLGVGL
jgi:hypothetical protein